MFSLNKLHNADIAIIKLLKNLSINIDPSIICAELDKHPDYPSLLAISDVLTNFNIENSAFRIEPNELKNVPCPFIAHTNLNNGDFFLVIVRMNENTVLVSSDKWNGHKLSIEEFKKIFNGVILR